MNRAGATLILGIILMLSCAVLLAGQTSGWVVGIAGLFFVVGGTLLASITSVGYPAVKELVRRLPGVFSPPRGHPGDDAQTLLRVADFYRRGQVRQTESHIRAIQDPLLRQGAQLIVDRCSRAELDRALLWRIGKDKERARQHLSILQGLAGYAPAFGMMGTLLGLLRLLFVLGESDLDMVGAAMGFAMITTVYGLAAANLVIKPLATKMDQQARQQIAWHHMKYELLSMLFKREHPAVMRDALQLFTSGEQEREAGRTAAPVTLVRA
jgi:chemotaxis protein MotA